MPLPYFSGHVVGSGKMGIKPLAFQDALFHDGADDSFGRAVIQHIGRRGYWFCSRCKSHCKAEWY